MKLQCLFVCLFVCPIITQEPKDRFATTLIWEFDKTTEIAWLEYSSTINHHPSTINHQPSTINHQPSTINHQTSNDTFQRKWKLPWKPCPFKTPICLSVLFGCWKKILVFFDVLISRDNIFFNKRKYLKHAYY